MARRVLLLLDPFIAIKVMEEGIGEALFFGSRLLMLTLVVDERRRKVAGGRLCWYSMEEGRRGAPIWCRHLQEKLVGRCSGASSPRDFFQCMDGGVKVVDPVQFGRFLGVCCRIARWKRFGRWSFNGSCSGVLRRATLVL